MNIKKINTINKINLGWLLLVAFTISCSLIPDPPTLSESVDISPEIQARYATSWAELIKDIHEDNKWQGRANIWGGGSLDMHFWFKDGDLWDYMDTVDPDKHYVLHIPVSKLGTFPAHFVDEKTAIMYMPSSASPKLYGALYVVRISNDIIYRTRNARGFANIANWDGKSVDTSDLIPIAVPEGAELPIPPFLDEAMFEGMTISYSYDGGSQKDFTVQAVNLVPGYDSFRQTRILGGKLPIIYFDSNTPYNKKDGDIYYNITVANTRYSYTLSIRNHKVVAIAERKRQDIAPPAPRPLTVAMFDNDDIDARYLKTGAAETALSGKDMRVVGETTGTITKITFNYTRDLYIDSAQKYTGDSIITYTVAVGDKEWKHSITIANNKIVYVKIDVNTPPPPPIVLPPIVSGKLHYGMFNNSDDSGRRIKYLYTRISFIPGRPPSSVDAEESLDPSKLKVTAVIDKRYVEVTFDINSSPKSVWIDTDISYTSPNHSNLKYSYKGKTYKLRIVNNLVTEINVR